jgi:hypothetical protein
MYRALMVLVAAAGGCLPAFGDDSNTDRPVVSQQQMMKDCIAKERAANNTAAIDDIKKTCREKIKSYNDHPSETAPPPANPH